MALAKWMKKYKKDTKNNPVYLNQDKKYIRRHSFHPDIVQPKNTLPHAQVNKNIKKVNDEIRDEVRKYNNKLQTETRSHTNGDAPKVDPEKDTIESNELFESKDDFEEIKPQNITVIISCRRRLSDGIMPTFSKKNTGFANTERINLKLLTRSDITGKMPFLCSPKCRIHFGIGFHWLIQNYKINCMPSCISANQKCHLASFTR